MRKARDFVEEYRGKGYPDERIKIIASMRPEPLRSEILKMIEEGIVAQEQVEPATVDASGTMPEAPADSKVAPPVKKRATASNDAPATTREVRSLRKQADALRKERDKVTAQLEKTRAELASVREKSAEADDLRKRVADVEPLRKQLDEMHQRQRELMEEKSKLEVRVTELEGELKRRDALLKEKEAAANEIESSLAKERTECEAALAHAAQLASEIEDQTERLRELDDVAQQLAESDLALGELRQESSRLQEEDQAKAKHMAELETEGNQVRSDNEELRRQIESNEQAITDLEEKLNSRESELESLREHFDIEAADLKKRAEQEMWVIQRRMSRVRRLAALGGTLAACLVFIISFLYFRGTGPEGPADIVPTANRESESPFADVPPYHAPDVVRVAQEEPAEDVAPVWQPIVLPVGTDRLEQTTVETPEPGSTTVEAPAVTPRVEYYVVQRNDSLWVISEKHLGTGARWKEIARENGISTTNPPILKPGMKLRITITESR